MKRVPLFKQSLARERGNTVPVVVGAILIVAVLAALAWLLIIKPSQVQDQVIAPVQAPPGMLDEEASPPADVGAMGLDELLSEAKNAMNERRIIAPAGNNAFEFYLRALEEEPENRVAQNALRETFPFAASAVEQVINSNAFDEAQRQIDLLAKADPGNYTLTILRSKLDAQRKLAARAEEQERRAEQTQTEVAATQPVAPEPAPVEEPPPPPPRAVAEQPAEPTPAPEPVAQEPVGPTRGAVLLESYQPEYPAAAARRRQEGWVDVRFTVDVDGSVRDVEAIDSAGGNVFNRPAIAAVSRWRFQPALDNGVPVKTVLVQRINFRL